MFKCKRYRLVAQDIDVRIGSVIFLLIPSFETFSSFDFHLVYLRTHFVHFFDVLGDFHSIDYPLITDFLSLSIKCVLYCSRTVDLLRQIHVTLSVSLINSLFLIDCIELDCEVFADSLKVCVSGFQIICSSLLEMRIELNVYRVNRIPYLLGCYLNIIFRLKCL